MKLSQPDATPGYPSKKEASLKSTRAPQNIPSLTGIRGAAALLVVMLHYPMTSSLPLVRNGGRGVDLFFILSGFILMHIHGYDFDRLSIKSIKTFARSRFLRVYPLHFIVLMAILAITIYLPGFVQWSRRLPGGHEYFSSFGFFQTLTLTNRIGLRDFGPWNGPSWSLSCEMLAYGAFPLLANFMSRVQKDKICVLVSTSLLAFFAILIPAGVGRVIFCFPAGMLLARAFHLRRPKQGGLFAFVGLLLTIATLTLDRFEQWSVFGFAGLIFGLTGEVGFISRTLASRPFVWLGQISFSLYLTHFTLINLTGWAIGWEGYRTLALVPICIALAWLCYLAIERPFHRVARNIRTPLPVLHPGALSRKELNPVK